ncbi:MAG TPA: hypothetical protein VFD32_05810 [Dehalococcoidia bacterium]|nr:hypothetical protein [Dehalococcoidia bacterium]
MNRPPLHPLLAARRDTRDTQEDLFHGQFAIVVARWFTIVAGIVLALWSTGDVSALPAPVALMVALMGMNFYVHARYLAHRPLNRAAVIASVAIDFAAILTAVAVWSLGAGSGFASPFFVCLYPPLLAIALVFPPRLSLPGAVLAVLAYAAIALTVGGVHGLNQQKDFAERLLTLGATAGLGAFYWRLQRQSERRAGQRRFAAPFMDDQSSPLAPAR